MRMSRICLKYRIAVARLMAQNITYSGFHLCRAIINPDFEADLPLVLSTRLRRADKRQSLNHARTSRFPVA